MFSSHYCLLLKIWIVLKTVFLRMLQLSICLELITSLENKWQPLIKYNGCSFFFHSLHASVKSFIILIYLARFVKLRLFIFIATVYLSSRLFKTYQPLTFNPIYSVPALAMCCQRWRLTGVFISFLLGLRISVLLNQKILRIQPEFLFNFICQAIESV